MVSHLTFLALEALLPAVVLVVVTGLLLRFAWKERRGQRVLLLEVFVLFLFGVLTVTGVPSIRYLTPDFTINLIPFSEVPQGCRELASAGAERSSLCPARHFTAVALGQVPRLLAHRSLRWWVIVVYRADAALQLPHHGLR